MRRRENGQAILEFALAMPVLLAFILFIIDAGLFAYSYVSVTNAVRDGARCAAVGGTASAVSTRVANSSGGLPNTLTVPAPVYAPAPAAVGGAVTVSANYTYDFVTPIGLVPGLTDLAYSKSVQMRMETATTTKATC